MVKDNLVNLDEWRAKHPREGTSFPPKHKAEVRFTKYYHPSCELADRLASQEQGKDAYADAPEHARTARQQAGILLETDLANSLVALLKPRSGFQEYIHIQTKKEPKVDDVGAVSYKEEISYHASLPIPVKEGTSLDDLFSHEKGIVRCRMLGSEGAELFYERGVADISQPVGKDYITIRTVRPMSHEENFLSYVRDLAKTINHFYERLEEKGMVESPIIK